MVKQASQEVVPKEKKLSVIKSVKPHTPKKKAKQLLEYTQSVQFRKRWSILTSQRNYIHIRRVTSMINGSSKKKISNSLHVNHALDRHVFGHINGCGKDLLIDTAI